MTWGHAFTKDVIKEFSKDEDRKQECEMNVYRPDLFKSIEDPIIVDEDNLNQLNSYRPGGVDELPPDTLDRQDELQMFLDLINRLTEKEKTGWTDKDVEVPLNEYVLDHLTLPFRYPGRKNRSSILMHSFSNQTGKGTLFETVRRGLGKDNCIVITPENAIRREKSFLPHQLVLIDEIFIDGDDKKKQSVLNVLKPLMTAEIHDCRPLFKESRQIYSTCNFMLFTNHKDAIAIEKKDARYTCIDVNKTREEMGGSSFFDQYWYKALLKGTLSNVVKYFLTRRDLSKTFDPAGVSLSTKFKEVMAKHGGHPIFTDVQSDIKAKEEPFRNDVISIHEVDNYKKEKGKKSSLNELADAFSKLGCQKLGEVKHKLSRKTPTFYIVRNYDFYKDKSKHEIVNKYFLPIECKQDSISSEFFNMTAHEVSEVRSHIKEVEAYEDFLDPNEPEVIKIDEVTDIPDEIKKRS